MDLLKVLLLYTQNLASRVYNINSILRSDSTWSIDQRPSSHIRPRALDPLSQGENSRPPGNQIWLLNHSLSGPYDRPLDLRLDHTTSCTARPLDSVHDRARVGRLCN